MTSNMTRRQFKLVYCPSCHARPGRPCREYGSYSIGVQERKSVHSIRADLARAYRAEYGYQRPGAYNGGHWSFFQKVSTDKMHPRVRSVLKTVDILNDFRK